jgi:hypothetical protein
MTAQRAGQVISAAECTLKIETIVSVLPSKESHVRELLKLEGDEKATQPGRLFSLVPKENPASHPYNSWACRPSTSTDGANIAKPAGQ